MHIGGVINFEKLFMEELIVLWIISCSVFVVVVTRKREIEEEARK